MSRMVTFTQAAADALADAKPGQSRDLLTYLVKTWSVGVEVPQLTITEDLMRKQFTPLKEGGVLTAPSSSSLAKIYELHKTDWIKKGYMTVASTKAPKPKRLPGKLAQKMLAYEARITELEDALKGAYALLSQQQKEAA